jgi:hypothetical protein
MSSTSGIHTDYRRFLRLAYLETCGIILLLSAGVVQLVEHLLAKEKVMGSSPIARSFLFLRKVKTHDLVVWLASGVCSPSLLTL